MFAKQLTVFIENRSGRLAEVLGVLKENGVNILSLSLADTTEFGLLRLIVNNAAYGKEKLTENGFSSLLSDVSIIEIPHKVGSLQKLLQVIDENGVNIEYMYSFAGNNGHAQIGFKTSTPEKAIAVLQNAGAVVL